MRHGSSFPEGVAACASRGPCAGSAFPVLEVGGFFSCASCVVWLQSTLTEG